MIGNPLISIVVPVYNVSRYLVQCVDSIIGQTYKNIEIILVDDGSTDDSGKICDDFAVQDERVKVVHKKNGGLSDARNVGIRMAEGDYIGFVDSDDFISPYYYEILLKTIVEYGADVVSLKRETGFWEDEEDFPELAQTPEDYTCQQYSSYEAVKEMFLQNITTGAQFKMIKRELFKDICFPTSYLYEDLATTYKLFLVSNNVALVEGKLYAYRKRADSIIRKNFSVEKLIVIKITDQILEDMKHLTPDLYKSAIARCFSLIYSVFLQVPTNDIEHQKVLWKEIRKYRMSILKLWSFIPRKKIIFAAIVSYGGRRFAHVIGKKMGQKGTMYR